MTRLEQLQALLAGRLQSDGAPKKGYAHNVVALRAEIRRLSAQTVTQVEAVATDSIDSAPTAA